MSEILSIFFYLIIYILSAFLVHIGIKYSNKRISILLLILSILIPSIVAGIRYNVGVDFPAYQYMFNNAVAKKTLYWRNIEPASAFIIYISAAINSQFLMYFLFSAITNSCFLLAFMRFFKKDNKKTTVAFFIYLCILFSTTLNAMRSGVSLSLLTLAFSYLIQKWTPSILFNSFSFIIVATLFHASSLIALLFIPIFWITQKYNLKTKKSLYVITWTIYTLMAIIMPLICRPLSIAPIIGEYSRYLDNVGKSFSIPRANIIMSIPLIIAIYCIYKNKFQNNDFKKISYCALFYIPLSIIVGWLSHEAGLSRISFTLEPLIIVLMTHLLTLSPHQNTLSKKRPSIRSLCIIMVICLMFIRNINWSHAIPYTTFFQKEILYETKN